MLLEEWRENLAKRERERKVEKEEIEKRRTRKKKETDNLLENEERK